MEERVVQPLRVTAVVVTWNRCRLLAESLHAVLGQSRPPQQVVVVDNASTDGTGEMLTGEFPHVDVVRSAYNIGGAGGFAAGLRRALATGEPDAVWLLDDDTIPSPSALAELVAARAGYPGDLPAVVASKAVWTDGREHPMNVPRVRPGASRAARADAGSVACLPVRSTSFVSVLVTADVVRQRGLPEAGYFLWNDDFEYSTRLIRGGVGLYCPASVVVHKTRTFGSTDADPGERFYYEVRNKIWMFGRSRSLSGWEKVLYGGSSLRRWLRTVAHSRDRGLLLRAGARGLADGLRRRPAPTAKVLRDAAVHEVGDRAC